MGVVSGKGLSALIREEFGVRIALVTMLGLFVMNTFTTSAEFAGIAAASEIFHLSRYIAVPLALVLVYLFVLRFNNKIVERTFVGLSLVYVTYIISGIEAHPNWGEVVRGTLVPTLDLKDPAYIGMIVGLIGTTISPYMQFYLQSAVVEQGTRPGGLLGTRIDVINGSILGIIVAAFMIIANAATIFVYNAAHPQHQIVIVQAADVAKALEPLAGRFAETLFAFGILNAGLFTATVLPLSTAYLICEAMGFEASVSRRFSEAPVFFGLFFAGLAIGAALVLIPGVPLLKVAFYSQVLQGLLTALRASADADHHQSRASHGNPSQFAGCQYHRLGHGHHRRGHRALLHDPADPKRGKLKRHALPRLVRARLRRECRVRNCPASRVRAESHTLSGGLSRRFGVARFVLRTVACCVRLGGAGGDAARARVALRDARVRLARRPKHGRPRSSRP